MFNEKIATRDSYGQALKELGEQYNNLFVLDADLSATTKTCVFAKAFPERFFNIGIAEQDLLATAAGIATCSNVVFASTFAMFASGRAYDQVRSSICCSNLNVKIAATHAGVTVGEDGATHQSLEDLSLMRGLPNMTVLCPSDDTQAKWAIKEAYKINGPVYIRLARAATNVIYDANTEFQFGKGIQIGNGTDATIISTGVTTSQAILAKETLEKEGINVRVVDIHTIKPLDKDLILKCAQETKRIITVEDHSITGGLGTSVCEVLSEYYPTKVTRMGIKNTFGQSGKWQELMHFYKIDSEAIIDEIKSK